MVAIIPQVTVLTELSVLPDSEILDNLQKTEEILQSAINDGLNHFIIAFSGGKDSSLMTTVVVEGIRRGTLKNVTVDIVYSDTLMELPPFAENAFALLEFISKISLRENLPIKVHKAVAPIEHRFWFLVLGKGYPPPHNHFRWCTERLKIWPNQKLISSFKNRTSVMLTGVRWDESNVRNGRMKAAMCSTKNDSECGQGVWLNSNSSIGIPNLAPIAHWRTCKIWDFLLFADMEWGWPFKSLNKLYGENGSTRFGCWMCTLVKEDKALRSVVQHKEWEKFGALESIRQRILVEGRKPENRLLQPNGNAGRTNLEFRQNMLDNLLKLQNDLGVDLITPHEVDAIMAYWETEIFVGSPYTKECKYWKWNKQPNM